jgi:uncharacterized membrane protein YedE/YeeE
MDIVIEPAQWLRSLGGGLLIGLSAVLLLAVNGRIAGISSVLAGILPSARVVSEWSWRAAFIAGLILGGALFALLWPGALQHTLQTGWTGMALAGLVVGFGTRMGSGCTSGHGVCGIARTSRRSIVATLTFMASGMLTVFVVHHVL